MDANLVAGLGRSIFGILIALMRPTVRARDGSWYGDGERRLLPLQSGVLSVEYSAGMAQLSIDQTLANPHAEALRVTSTLPLPRHAVVCDLALRSMPNVAPTVSERHAARALFNLFSRSGGPAALLSEDAPGVISQELGELAPRASVRVVTPLAYGSPGPSGSAEALRLSVNFDAAPYASATAAQRRRTVRLGSGRILDQMFGINEKAPSWVPRVISAHKQRPAMLSSKLRSAALRGEMERVLPAREHDVLVSYDTAAKSGAAWRGELAGRVARLVASVGTIQVPPPFGWSAPFRDLSDLMNRYAELRRDEADRRSLMRQVTELGLRHRIVTLWTSLVAVAQPLQQA